MGCLWVLSMLAWKRLPSCSIVVFDMWITLHALRVLGANFFMMREAFIYARDSHRRAVRTWWRNFVELKSENLKLGFKRADLICMYDVLRGWNHETKPLECYIIYKMSSLLPRRQLLENLTIRGHSGFCCWPPTWTLWRICQFRISTGWAAWPVGHISANLGPIQCQRLHIQTDCRLDVAVQLNRMFVLQDETGEIFNPLLLKLDSEISPAPP